jgi:hypothetical protein
MGFGRAAFLPFDLLVPRGVPDGSIVLCAFAIALTLLALGRRRDAVIDAIDAKRDLLLLAVPSAFYAVHLAVFAPMHAHVADANGKLAVILGATAFGAALSLYARATWATASTSKSGAVSSGK